MENESNLEKKNDKDNLNEIKLHSFKELMIIEAVKKIKNPFVNLTVQDVAKDLKMGENFANQIFKREDFPSVNIGKPKTVTLLAYLIWKMDRRT